MEWHILMMHCLINVMLLFESNITNRQTADREIERYRYIDTHTIYFGYKLRVALLLSPVLHNAFASHKWQPFPDSPHICWHHSPWLQILASSVDWQSCCSVMNSASWF